MPVVGEPCWSVIIPAYNEALRLPAYLGEVVAYFDGRDEPYEILVVDDGSRDETAARVLEAQATHASVPPNVPVERPRYMAIFEAVYRSRSAPTDS